MQYVYVAIYFYPFFFSISLCLYTHARDTCIIHNNSNNNDNNDKHEMRVSLSVSHFRRLFYATLCCVVCLFSLLLLFYFMCMRACQFFSFAVVCFVNVSIFAGVCSVCFTFSLYVCTYT